MGDDMRARRGNYMILFAMLLPLMLGFMALAIDIGRLRVARVQLQGAADAAALAALEQLRDGGGYGAAVGAANNVANAVRMQRVTESGGSVEFDVALRTGAWNFANSTWTDSNLVLSGITVNVTQRQPLGLLFAPIFNMGGSEGGGFAATVFSGGPMTAGGPSSGDSKSLRLGRRAAMRPRDVVIAVDITNFNRDNLPGIRSELSDMVMTIRQLGVLEDRIAVVGFAGEAVQLLPLTLVEEEFPTIRNAVNDLNPCEVDLEAWFHWYRFFEGALDPEIPGEPVFDYHAIWFNELYADGLPRMRWDVDSYEAELLIETGVEEVGLSEALWGAPLSEEAQCAAWSMSQILFEYADPRRVEFGSFVPLEFAPLTCHAGNYWEGEADRFEFATSYMEVDCSATGWEEVFPGHPALMDGGDLDPAVDYPDRSYSQAGTNPGAGLMEAASMFEGAWPTRNEPTVILITGAAPSCGPTVETTAPDCAEDFEKETLQALGLLEARRANTHVIALVEGGSADEAYLSDKTTGRGIFFSTEDVNDLDEFLTEVARDIRLQVVE